MFQHSALPSKARARISVVHLVVIVLSLVMTVGAYEFSKVQIENRTQARFDVSRDRTLALITERMKKYEDALWSGVSAIQSHGGDISRSEWRSFADNLKLKEKYPGISGIGVIHYLSENTVSDYLEIRQKERPGYGIHPAHDQAQYIPITYIEPEASNAAAVGLDLAHEVNRRTAAMASRDTGTSQITGPIVLVQDAGSTPGFLFYAPFYNGGEATTLSERRDRIAGAVYAPFVVRELMEGLLAKDLRQVRFSIRDGENLIYDEHSQADALRDPNPMFTDQVSFNLYGRTWQLDVHSNLAFRQANSYSQPTFILLGGLLIEALIISLLLLMSRANAQAVRYANEVTAALRLESEKLADSNFELAESNNELAQKNAELEQFAYAASHDLKTPIRGIQCITEIVEEDLCDYLASAQANPEIRDNLNRIIERTRRMSDLINGVMAYSRVEPSGLEGNSLSMRKTIEEFTADFDLDDRQMSLESDVDEIHVDPFNFRRVLENLVGNGIKHSAKGKDLRIKIAVRTAGDRLQVSVLDNGPGIEPDAHHRIFDVFQTLREPGAVESTGIGLAIVKKAVERNAGTVNIVSAPGQGAKFTFDWPCKDRGNSDAMNREAA